MAEKRNNKKEIAHLSFEQTIESLTQIVDKIETGQVSLAESLQQYEKGMAMIKHCRGILLDAEKRIEQIAEAEGESDEDDDGEDSKDNSLF